ncbi:MAG TPA: flagellar FlbD family protein [Bryobacteraceae bacterium]|jgi:flagellar protein FlbD
MIRLTRINRVPLVVNADLIEHLEITPDTVVSLTNGQKFVVVESADEIIRRVVSYRRQLAAFPQSRLAELSGQPSGSERDGGAEIEPTRQCSRSGG